MVEIGLSNLVVDVAQSELLDTVVYVDDSIENLVFNFIVTLCWYIIFHTQTV